MEVRYTSVFQLHGACKLPNEAEQLCINGIDDWEVSASLAINPEPHFFHIDRSAALAFALLKRAFGQDSGVASLSERIANETEKMRTQRFNSIDTGLFLAFNGKTEWPTIESLDKVDTEDFAYCLELIPKSEVKEHFHKSLHHIISAIILSLPESANHKFTQVGDVIYGVDPTNGKTIYSFGFQMGAVTAFSLSQLSEETFSNAEFLISRMAVSQKMDRPISLLLSSLSNDSGEMQTFITAWSALEMFINSAFKNAYENQLFALMEAGVPSMASAVFARLKEVMHDKFRLADKFRVLSSILNPATAAADASEFESIKKIRDELFHTQDASTSLPTSSVQKLMLKYLKLHL